MKHLSEFNEIIMISRHVNQVYEKLNNFADYKPHFLEHLQENQCLADKESFNQIFESVKQRKFNEKVSVYN